MEPHHTTARRRLRVKQIVGYWGTIVDRAEFSDGEVWVWRQYRQCNSKGRPARSWNTVSVDFTNLSGYDDNSDPILGWQRVDYKGDGSARPQSPTLPPRHSAHHAPGPASLACEGCIRLLYKRQ